jgi:FkbM family methyltransferase
MKIFKKFINLYYDYKYANRSFSQEGEDQLLYRLLNGKNSGFYIDIGAHHPFKYSNTYKFYKLGWRGINIDAMPGSMKFFNKIRPLDINIEVPISSKTEILNYYIFNEPALNTFSKEEANYKDGLNDYKILNTIKLQTSTLEQLLLKNMAKNQKIDFMSIDVEGFDLDVLKSNNWDLFKPDYILIEELSDIENIINKKSKVNIFLQNHGYTFIARTMNTSFYTILND